MRDGRRATSRIQLVLRSVGILGGAVLTACTSATATLPAEFTVRVDSISGPTAVSGGAAWQQQLWGTVGPSGCTTFKELRTTRAATQMDVTVIGQRVDGAACGAGSALLNGLAVTVGPTIATHFTLVVHQPNGSTLSRSILSE
jgi:hypothetical protein